MNEIKDIKHLSSDLATLLKQYGLELYSSPTISLVPERPFQRQNAYGRFTEIEERTSFKIEIDVCRVNVFIKNVPF